MRSYHWGKEGIVWFVGVVESRFDPLMAGRLKVRVYGWHDEDKEKTPTDDLPWAYPIIPPTFTGRMNTVGFREGAWVCGFFLDGPHAQEPLIWGLIPGFPEKEADPSIGYFDPRPDSLLEGHQVPREPEELQQHDDGSGNDIFEQPKKSRFPDKAFIPEQDTTRYARGYKDGYIEKTVVPLKIENIGIGQTDIPTGEHTPGTGTDVASPGTFWTETETPYDAEYPYNECFFSEGGHIIEVDNTPGAERLHFYHRSGSFREIHTSGQEVEKIVDKHQHIVLKSLQTHIEAFTEHTTDWYSKEYVNKDGRAGFNKDLTVGPGGDINFTTEGGKFNIYLNGDWNVYVNGDAYVEIEGDLYGTVHGNAHLTVDLNFYGTVAGEVNLVVGLNCNVEIGGNLNCLVGGNWSGRVLGNKTQYIGGNYDLVVGGEFNVMALGGIRHTSPSDIENVSASNILNAALLTISDTAPVIFHNAAITNCSAILTGFTIDSDGDTTEPGPIGPIPSLSLGGVTPFIQSAITAVTTDLFSTVVSSVITEVVNEFLLDTELSLEATNTEVAQNSDAPASGAAAGSGGAAGVGGGPLGPALFVDGPGGFLWKPSGANSGVATVLTDGSGGVALYTAIQDGTNDDGTPKYRRGDQIASANFIKNYNGDGRGIYRFDQPGSSYGTSPVVVGVGDNDYVVQNPSVRND